MMLLDRYQRTPYSNEPDPPNSFDCWTMVIAYREERHGRRTPFLMASDVHESLTETVQACPWVQSQAPQDGDVIMAARLPGMRFHHCGVYEGGQVLHAQSRILLTPWRTFVRYYKRFEIWRLAGE